MGKNILYITFVDFDEQKSGSSVRPKKIYEAFNSIGVSVKLLEGQQNKKKLRWKSVWKYFKEIRNNKYDLCYVEPPSGVVFNICDHLLLLYISKIKKVPTGVFYRDAFWKLSKDYPKSGLKSKILIFMHKFDWIIFNMSSNVMYFPSESFAEHFKCNNKVILMPGAEKIAGLLNGEENSFIYVGGIEGSYGADLLLESFQKAYDINNAVRLNLVCRNENDTILKYKNREWLNLFVGKSGKDELKEIYDKSKYAILSLIPGDYMDLAVPIKIFEYISYEKPILSTDCKEISKIITKYNIGKISNPNSEDLSKSIIDMISDEKLYNNYKDNVKNRALKEVLWSDRAWIVIKTLLDE